MQITVLKFECETIEYQRVQFDNAIYIVWLFNMST